MATLALPAKKCPIPRYVLELERHSFLLGHYISSPASGIEPRVICACLQRLPCGKLPYLLKWPLMVGKNDDFPQSG